MEWLKEQGGAVAMEERNMLKSKAVYEVVDRSEGFYWYVWGKCCTSVGSWRSGHKQWMFTMSQVFGKFHCPLISWLHCTRTVWKCSPLAVAVVSTRMISLLTRLTIWFWFCTRGCTRTYQYIVTLHVQRVWQQTRVVDLRQCQADSFVLSADWPSWSDFAAERAQCYWSGTDRVLALLSRWEEEISELSSHAVARQVHLLLSSRECVRTII